MHKRAQSQELTILMICIEVFFFKIVLFPVKWPGSRARPKKLTSGRTQRKTLYVDPNSRTIVALSLY